MKWVYFQCKLCSWYFRKGVCDQRCFLPLYFISLSAEIHRSVLFSKWNELTTLVLTAFVSGGILLRTRLADFTLDFIDSSSSKIYKEHSLANEFNMIRWPQSEDAVTYTSSLLLPLSIGSWKIHCLNLSQ